MAEYRSRRLRPRRVPRRVRSVRVPDEERGATRGLYVMPLVVMGTILIGLAAGCYAAARLWWP